MGQDDLQPYLEQLAGLPFVSKVRARPGGHVPDLPFEPDARIHIWTDSGPSEFFVELKRAQVGYSVMAQLTARARETKASWLLMAPAISGPLGDQLAQSGVQFMDLAGNCFVRIGDRVARIQGKRAPRIQRSRGIRTAGYKVLFALLAEPRLLSESLRAIAAEAGTSRQAVVDMLERLVDAGFAVQARRGRHWVAERRSEAIDLWVSGYKTLVRPSLEIGTYRLAQNQPEAIEAALSRALNGRCEFRFGGTAGAFRLVDHYRGDRTVVHLASIPTDLVRLLRAMPSPEGQLLLLHMPGPVALRGPSPEVAHPLLVYSELLTDRDPRAAETAKLVHERHLDGPWD